MSKKKTAGGNARPADLASIPGIKRASELPTPERKVELRSATAKPDPAEFTMPAAEACVILNMTNRTLIRWAEDGELPFIKGIKKTSPYMFRPADVAEFAKRSFRYSPGKEAVIKAVPPDDAATNPSIERIMQTHGSLFRGWTDTDVAELYSMHGDGGSLTDEGVIAAAERINRKRTMRDKFEVIMEADEQHVRTLSTLIDAIYKEATIRPKRSPSRD